MTLANFGSIVTRNPGDMNVFGSTRSSVRSDHALIAPDSFVRAPLPGWEKTDGIILISPRIGARFVQYLALMERGGVSSPALPGVERFVYVVEGEITLTYAPQCEESLKEGGYLFLPADVDYPFRAKKTSKLN